MDHVRIRPQKNVIDDGFLDLIGREFATHEQGIAEWLKNANDASVRDGLSSRNENVFLRFTDGQGKKPPAFECIDFVGMGLQEIEVRLKPWGKLSQPSEVSGNFGGYGIGGKFYMREMFESSYLVTYRGGYVNVFGFDKTRRYGYAAGYRNRPMEGREALEFAGIGETAEGVGMATTIASGERGFSALKGVGPKGISGTIDVESICRRLQNHPQAQRPLKSLRVWVIHNGAVLHKGLLPRPIQKRPGFEKPWTRRIPALIPYGEGPDTEGVRITEDSGNSGTLRLFLSSEYLARKGKMASLNRIDFLDGTGVVASYRLDELGVKIPHKGSIFGECRLPGLDNAQGHWGKKTRDTLVDSPESRALLRWVGSQIADFSDMVRRHDLRSRKTGLREGSKAAGKRSKEKG
jgi:hypothetical protein